MRRVDRQMDEAFALEVVDRCAFAVVSMCQGDGTPYSVPLSIVRDGKYLYFHCAEQGQKTENLHNHPAVHVVCVGQVTPVPRDFTTEYESAMVTGQAVRVTEREEKIHALRLICQRYAAENMAAFDSAIQRSLERTDIWRIEMQEITGKRKKYDAEGKEMKFGRQS